LGAAKPVQQFSADGGVFAMRASIGLGMATLIIGLSQVRAEVTLNAYADADGAIDAHKLTCAQLANLDRTDADLLNAWYDGWYNGLNHKHFVHSRNGTIVSHEVTAYCKEHPDKRIIDAIAVVSHDERVPLTADTTPLKSEGTATAPTLQKDAIHIKIDPGGRAGVEGEGILTYNGSSYPIAVGGIGIGKSGFVSGEIEGVVHNLRSPGDIVGTYGSGGAGFTIVGGHRMAELRNDKGALIELHGVPIGREMNLNLAGMTIRLK
jgi:hypothetical protein